jgi:hypothetical protein
MSALPAEALPAEAWPPGAGTRPPGCGAPRGRYRERRRRPAALAVRGGRAGYGTLCQPGPRDAPSAPLRLTPRGRVVAAGMLMVLAGAPWLAAVGAARTAGSAGQPRGTGRNAGQAVVEPGETLWSIARRADPGTGTWIVVQRMMRLNALSGPRIMPGERLRLPSG